MSVVRMYNCWFMDQWGFAHASCVSPQGDSHHMIFGIASQKKKKLAYAFARHHR